MASPDNCDPRVWRDDDGRGSYDPYPPQAVSPDHAATVREALPLCPAHQFVSKTTTWCPACEACDAAFAALDALVAALAQAEHERDEARRNLDEQTAHMAGALRREVLARERAERERDQAIKALRKLNAMLPTGYKPKKVVRNVLAAIEKENNVH